MILAPLNSTITLGHPRSPSAMRQRPVRRRIFTAATSKQLRLDIEGLRIDVPPREGASADTQRVVDENCRALGFETHGFEKR